MSNPIDPIRSNKSLLGIVLFLYFLSGFTSLAYEVLWARMLSLQFGVSIFGVVVTVAAFMLGLGGGSLLGTKFLKSVLNPLRLFAAVELCVALISLSIPILFHWIETLQPGVTLQSTLAIWYVWQFLFTGVVLLLPATLMGFGFPLILSLFEGIPSSLGSVYAINTLGASFGALMPLVLLPALGWTFSLYVIIIISLFIAGISWLISLKLRTLWVHHKEVASKPLSSDQVPMLVAYAGIGAVALMLEISWTRLFGMVFLRTEYVLAIILAVFLIGVAAGSYVSRYLKNQAWINGLPIIAGAFVLVSLWQLPIVTNSMEFQNLTSLNQALLVQGMLIALLTLPVTLIFGAWLPLLNQLLGNSGISGARLYGANSVGAAVGALVAGFLLIPAIGTNATIVVSAILIILFSMAWVKIPKLAFVAILLAVAAIPLYTMAPVSKLMPQVYSKSRDLYRYEDALNITHVIAKPDGQRLLLADLQRMDASSDPVSVESQRNQSRLPLLLHAKPQTALFLGLGTGISLSSSLAYPQLQRTAVEISTGAINAANQWFDVVNRNVLAQTIVIRDDARRFLKTDPSNYDVVVGDLFHPDLVGRSALLSKQQFQRVKDHMAEGGIFVQWIALNQFETESLEIILRTFKKVFPDAVMFVDAFRVALVGYKSSMIGLEAIQRNLDSLTVDGKRLILGGENKYAWLGRYWGKINVNESGRIQDEWAPQIEYRLPEARYSGDLDLVKVLSYMLEYRPHVSVAAKELNIDENSFAAFERAYIATELAHRSWLALLQNNAQEGQRLLKLAFQANPKDRWISYAVADATLENFDINRPKGVNEKDLLESILKIRPDHVEALKRLWHLAINEGDMEAALHFKKQIAKLSPLDSGLSK